MLPAPQLPVFFIGPARRDRSVYQDDPPVDYLDGVGRGRHEFLQHRLYDRDQERHVTGNCRLRGTVHFPDDFLRSVLPQVLARNFDCLVQAEDLRPSCPVSPRLIQCLIYPADKFLHLREHQAGGTMIAQRFSRDLRILWPELSDCLVRAVAFLIPGPACHDIS
jgi:hypothetical protein